MDTKTLVKLIRKMQGDVVFENIGRLSPPQILDVAEAKMVEILDKYRPIEALPLDQSKLAHSYAVATVVLVARELVAGLIKNSSLFGTPDLDKTAAEAEKLFNQFAGEVRAAVLVEFTAGANEADNRLAAVLKDRQP